MSKFIESTNLLNNENELRQQISRDGYLFFRSLIDKKAVLRVREDITNILLGANWLDTGTNPINAETSRILPLDNTKEYLPVYDKIQQQQSFHGLAHEPAIMSVIKNLLGESVENVLPHPCKNFRAILPNQPKSTTAKHQDYPYIQGNTDVWTVWIPLGDCPVELGPLTVLVGSHELGLLPTNRGLIEIAESELEKGGKVWASSPFELGDVLVFHCLTVHKGLPNISSDRLRLSVDYRYQRYTDPIMEDLLKPHKNRLTWKEVYKDWESDDYKYYWKQFDLNTVPREKI